MIWDPSARGNPWAVRTQLLDADEDFVSSPFAVAGDRAFVLGNKAMYALACGG